MCQKGSQRKFQTTLAKNFFLQENFKTGNLALLRALLSQIIILYVRNIWFLCKNCKWRQNSCSNSIGTTCNCGYILFENNNFSRNRHISITLQLSSVDFPTLILLEHEFLFENWVKIYATTGSTKIREHRCKIDRLFPAIDEITCATLKQLNCFILQHLLKNAPSDWQSVSKWS